MCVSRLYCRCFFWLQSISIMGSAFAVSQLLFYYQPQASRWSTQPLRAQSAGSHHKHYPGKISEVLNIHAITACNWKLILGRIGSKNYVMVMLTILCHCIIIAILGLGDSVLCSPQVRKKWWKMKKSSSSQFFISLQKVARIVALPEGHVAVLQLSQTGEKWSMPPYTMLDLSFSLSVLHHSSTH